MIGPQRAFSIDIFSSGHCCIKRSSSFLIFASTSSLMSALRQRIKIVTLRYIDEHIIPLMYGPKRPFPFCYSPSHHKTRPAHPLFVFRRSVLWPLARFTSNGSSPFGIEINCSHPILHKGRTGRYSPATSKSFIFTQWFLATGIISMLLPVLSFQCSDLFFQCRETWLFFIFSIPDLHHRSIAPHTGNNRFTAFRVCAQFPFALYPFAFSIVLSTSFLNGR